MQTHKENIIELRNIRSLSGKNFLIPDYQRGYRWTTTQAKEMLRDFNEFIEAGKNTKQVSDDYYCLQPIVVKPNSWEDCEGKKVEGYEVIDGQQRLTTLLLLLKALFGKDTRNRDEVPDFKLFSISYQTREDSKEFLENIEVDSFREQRAYVCIDFYHINMVFNLFLKELNSSGSIGYDRTLVELLLNQDWAYANEEDEDEGKEDQPLVDKARNVRLIWYEIGNEETASAEDIFTRLNIGKIPLTNAELIKAMFLKESNFGRITATKEKDIKAQQLRIALQQNKIAEEWNVMEQKLQRDEFWYFLGASSAEKGYETRIEFIFDLMAKWDKDSETYHTFNHFQRLLKAAGNRKAAENVWKTVKNLFRELEYWYNDRTLYHLIGFLIECGIPLQKIKNAGMKKTENTIASGEMKGEEIRLKKDEFLDKVKSMVSDCMAGINIETLQYPSNDLRKILLLFNILSVVDNQASDIRFPFDKYKKENWDKEHIASQTDKDKSEVPQDNSKRIEWIEDMLYYFTGIRAKDAMHENEYAIFDEADNNQFVIKSVRDYLDSENKACEELRDDEQKALRRGELDIISDLLHCKELSLLTSKQRSASGQKEEYDTILKDLYRRTRTYFKEDRLSEYRKDLLCNMALLNASINRSYGNAFFAIKRMHIQTKDAEGIFIPPATKNVFMKYYSKRVDNMLVWTNDDANGYLEAIKKKLAPYLNS